VVLWPLGFIPGIILGYLAKAQIRENPRLQGVKYAVAGIRVGYCFLVIFALFLIWYATTRTGAH